MRIVILTTDNREAFKDYSNPVPHFGPAPAALLEGFAGLPEIEVHVVSCLRQPVESPVTIAPNIFYHPVLVHKLGWMRTLYLGCILPVRTKIREINPHLVHGQGTERDCAMSAVFSGFPNVLTIHGNMLAIATLLKASPGTFYWIANKLEGVALGRTGGVFCNSAYTEQLVQSRAKRTWRVPNALADVYFSELPPRQPAVRPVIVNVGHIGTRKRQLEILAVAEHLHAEGLQFEIHFYGSCNPQDPYGQTFLQKIDRAEEAGYAKFYGFQTTAEIVFALDRADALIHFPSEEAFGLAPAEGLARNLKLFAAKIGGVIDIATGVEGAELLEPHDWEGLRNSIAAWLRNGAPRPSRASAEMRARYHSTAIAQRHVEIYREVLDGQSRHF